MARLLGLSARIYIPNGLSAAAVDAIKGEGAELIQVDAIYDAVVEAAAASTSGSSRDVLIEDTAWAGYTEVPAGSSTDTPPFSPRSMNHWPSPATPGADLVACPVGVGSLAHAMVDHYRNPGICAPSLLSVEPATAACIAQSLQAGRPIVVDTSFPTIMLRDLNRGTPSELGWPSLLAGLDGAVSVSEDECRQAVLDLGDLGQDAGPCGAATLAGVRAAGRRRTTTPAGNHQELRHRARQHRGPLGQPAPMKERILMNNSLNASPKLHPHRHRHRPTKPQPH